MKGLKIVLIAFDVLPAFIVCSFVARGGICAAMLSSMPR